VSAQVGAEFEKGEAFAAVESVKVSNETKLSSLVLRYVSATADPLCMLCAL
jgi:hypothetical protein